MHVEQINPTRFKWGLDKHCELAFVQNVSNYLKPRFCMLLTYKLRYAQQFNVFVRQYKYWKYISKQSI